MQSPKPQNRGQVRDHLHTPYDILSSVKFIPGQVALQQSPLPFNLTITKMRKKDILESWMPKKKLIKECRAATPSPTKRKRKNHIKMIQNCLF